MFRATFFFSENHLRGPANLLGIAQELFVVKKVNYACGDCVKGLRQQETTLSGCVVIKVQNVVQMSPCRCERIVGTIGDPQPGTT